MRVSVSTIMVSSYLDSMRTCEAPQIKKESTISFSGQTTDLRILHPDLTVDLVDQKVHPSRKQGDDDPGIFGWENTFSDSSYRDVNPPVWYVMNILGERLTILLLTYS